ncbi:MAG: LPS assembly protein LptD [Desulfuromonadaceae bacterium]|nr:LPS assembly protein LptD [Desulfuromonadaceae bacterium]MDD2854911.1 LPS assembly protein LptD [Desulfuromonadaceae bacterium]
MPIALRSYIIFLVICFWSQYASAATSSDENIHISADKMTGTSADSVYIAEGNVVVTSQGMNLVADKVKYDSITHTLEASGGVVLSKGTAVLKGEFLTLDVDSGRAEIMPTVLKVPESGMTLTAANLVRINENEFSSSSSELTSCDVPNPGWKFGAARLDVDLQGYATGRHVIFYVKDIPVLYIPWIAFPVVMEKRSGILFPRLGHSKSRGIQLDIPVYLVISPSQDVQIDLDMMSKRGVGTGIDYRYIRKRGSEGHASLYSIYDRVEDRWRWQLAQEHKEILSESSNLRMSLNFTGDRSFLADFGEKSGDYNRQSTDTVINVLKTWQNFAATAYLRYNDNLYTINNSATVQTLPSVGLAAVREKIFSAPLYFDFDSNIENLYRETAPLGQRLLMFPRITLSMPQNSYIQSSLYAGVHGRGYITEERVGGSDVHTNDGDLIPETGVRLSSSVYGIFDVGGDSLKKIRHEIIPEISYSFVPHRDQQNLPFYDYSDSLIQKNRIFISVASVVNGRFSSGDATEYRDISRIRLSADYKIDGERSDILTLVEDQKPWSDLVLESETLFNKEFRALFDTRYNVYEKNLSAVAAGVGFDDLAGNSLSAAYQMAKDHVEYFEGHLSTKIIRPLTLSYTARYSFDRSDFLESIYSLEYRHKCWSVNLAINERPGNQSYTVNFNLAGLGSR